MLPSMGMTSEKAVKSATKIKNAAPKQKYIEFLLSGTYNDASVAEIFRILSLRLRDTSWTIVFKALLVIHILIREGSQDAALAYLAENPRTITISGLTDAQYQGNNIFAYAEYLRARAEAYSSTSLDYVRDGQGRLKSLTVAKGLLRETEIVQKQMHSLLKCEFLTDDEENDITLTAFRMVTMDLLMLFSVVNEGTINILEHYFDMSRPDSERSLALYKRFASQTDYVVRFLRVARQFESATRLSVPNLKHASTDLAKLLEEDLNDSHFDERRGTTSTGPTKTATTAINGERPPPTPAKNARPTSSGLASRGTNDIFGNIQHPSVPTTLQTIGQQPQVSQQMQMQMQPQPTLPFQVPLQMQQPTSPFQAPFPTQQPTPFQTSLSTQQQPFGAQQAPTANGWQQSQTPQWNTLAQPQQTGLAAQNTGLSPPLHAQQLQPQNTGAGFGGYTPASQVQQEQQQSQQQLQQQQQQQPPLIQPISSAPPQLSLDFGFSQNQAFTPTPAVNSLAYQPTGDNNATQPTSVFGSMSTGGGPFGSQPFQPQLTSVPPVSRQRTSSNPFRTSATMQPQSTGLQPQVTGATNPFKRLNTMSSLPQLRPHPTAPLQPTATGSNPFSRPHVQQPPPPLPLQPQATGSTNPFRSSILTQQNTVQSTATIGGVAASNMPTVPVFGQLNQGR